MLMNSYEKIKEYDFGVCHADDLFLLFKPNAIPTTNNLEGMQKQKMFNQAKLGKPK